MGSGSFNDDDDNSFGDDNNIPDNVDLMKRGEYVWYDLDDAGHEYYCSVNSAWLDIVELNQNGTARSFAKAVDYSEFNIKKLWIRVCEAINEQDDMIESIEYDGV